MKIAYLDETTNAWAERDMTLDELAQRDLDIAAAGPTCGDLLVQIDADVDAIYAAVIGQRAEEYTAARNDATAFSEAGYAGPVPVTVQCWADAKGWTATEAANDIIAAAARLATLRDTLRSQRLAKKEAARLAAPGPEVAAVAAQWSAALAAIRAGAGL